MLSYWSVPHQIYFSKKFDSSPVAAVPIIAAHRHIKSKSASKAKREARDFIKILIISVALCGVSVSVSAAGASDSECPQDTDPAADCLSSAESSERPLGEDEDDMFVILPHLEDRELGEPNIDEEGAPVIWNHPLPFFGQAVTDLGFELPLPFGISVIPATFEQDLTLRDLSLGLQGEADRPIDAVGSATLRCATRHCR